MLARSVLLLALQPAIVQAQDLSGVEALVVPPLLAAPVLTALLRQRLLRSDAEAPFWPLFGYTWIELVLWLVFGFFAINAVWAERWQLQATVVLGIIGAGNWLLYRRLLKSVRRRSRARILACVLALPISLALITGLTFAALAAVAR